MLLMRCRTRVPVAVSMSTNLDTPITPLVEEYMSPGFYECFLLALSFLSSYRASPLSHP